MSDPRETAFLAAASTALRVLSHTLQPSIVLTLVATDPTEPEFVMIVTAAGTDLVAVSRALSEAVSRDPNVQRLLDPNAPIARA